MYSKICVTKIPKRENEKGRNNIFRDNGSKFSKNQSMVLSPANPKEDKEKENYTKRHHNKRLKPKTETFHSSLNKRGYSLKNNYTDN